MEIIIALIFFILSLGFAFLCNGVAVWLICWGLKAIGITSIFGWTVSFSWPLVLVFTLVTASFKTVVKKD
jgi:hypothetical protein